MSWALLDDNFPTNPKVMQAVQIHAMARDLYVCGLCYCRRFLTGGVIPKTALKGIGFTGNERKAAEALVTVGLWQSVEGGYAINDYALLYNDAADKAKKDDKSAKRREAGRKGGLSRAASVEANAKQTVKQTPSNAQAHGYGVGGSSVVLQEKKENVPPIDELADRLLKAYPSQGYCSLHDVTVALRDVMHGKPLSEFEALVARLEVHKRSARWTEQGGRFIPRLDRYLSKGIHASTMPSAEDVERDRATSKMPEWARTAS